MSSFMIITCLSNFPMHVSKKVNAISNSNGLSPYTRVLVLYLETEM